MMTSISVSEALFVSLIIMVIHPSAQGATTGGTHLAKCYGENPLMVCRAVNQSFTVTNTRSELTVRIPNASKHFADTYELKGFFEGKQLPPLSCTLKISGTQNEGETILARIAWVVIIVVVVVVGVAAVWCYRTKRFCFKPKEEQDQNQTARSLLGNVSDLSTPNDVTSQERDSANGMQLLQSSAETENKSEDFRDSNEEPLVREESNSDNIRSDIDVTSRKGQKPTARQDTTSGNPRCYFPKLTKEDGEQLLSSERNGHGSFLIRGRGEPNVFILLVNWHGKIFHYRVTKHQSEFRLGRNTFASLHELIEYHKMYDIDVFEGLNISRLIKPVEQDDMSE